MLIDHSREKLINAILYFLENTQYCGKTKLFKLLYFLDFLHFREAGRSVTGLEYQAWDNGPVPEALYNEFNDLPPDLSENIKLDKILLNTMREYCEIKPLRRFDGQHFTKREMRILRGLSTTLKYTRGQTLSEVTHLPNQPWEKTMQARGRSAKISYLWALDGTPGSITKKEALERRKFSEALKESFS